MPPRRQENVRLVMRVRVLKWVRGVGVGRRNSHTRWLSLAAAAAAAGTPALGGPELEGGLCTVLSRPQLQ